MKVGDFGSGRLMDRLQGVPLDGPIRDLVVTGHGLSPVEGQLRTRRQPRLRPQVARPFSWYLRCPIFQVWTCVTTSIIIIEPGTIVFVH